MNTKTTTLLCALTMLLGCNFSGFTYEKDDAINTAPRQQIELLNKKLFDAVTHNDSATARLLMSPKLIKDAGNQINQLVSLISRQDIKSYTILCQYHVHASAPKAAITLPHERAGNDVYTFTFQSPEKESFVSLLKTSSPGNEYLLTVLYSKYPDGWKINALQIGQYSLFGNTAGDYYRMARASYSKSYLVDAISDISISKSLLKPAGNFLQYADDKDITEFAESLGKEIDTKYPLPMTLSSVAGNPKVFRIYPRTTTEGFFPSVWYLTTTHLSDSVALKAENLQIRKAVDSLFTGIDKDKKYVFYFAFNQMPGGMNDVAHYGFVDSLMKK